MMLWQFGAWILAAFYVAITAALWIGVLYVIVMTALIGIIRAVRWMRCEAASMGLGDDPGAPCGGNHTYYPFPPIPPYVGQQCSLCGDTQLLPTRV